jgi:hypothetical protein
LNDSAGTEQARCEYTYHDVVNDDILNINPVAEELPVLAGIEAMIVTRCGTRVRQLSKKAVMARSESPPAKKAVNARSVSAKDFAARMKGCFVLRGPRDPTERKEGGNEPNDLPDTPNDVPDASNEDNDLPNNEVTQDVAHDDISLPTEAIEADNASLLNVVSQSMQGIDLLAELCGKFELDPFVLVGSSQTKRLPKL